eukprot:gene26212-34291_t
MDFYAYGKFSSLLGTEYSVDKETEYLIKFKFAFQLLTISNTADAQELFNLAISYPRRTTEKRINESHNLILNGIFQVESASSPDLIRAYLTIDGSPKILKFADAQKEYDIYSQLELTSDMANEYNFVHLEKLITDIDEHGKKAVVMPAFYTSLSNIPYLPETVVLNGAQRIKKALDYMHAKDIVHCDVKPSNILISFTGEWYLCDYGSCVKLSTRDGTAFTASYIPSDVAKKPSKKLDFVLLTVASLLMVNPDSLNLQSGFNTEE